MREKPGHGENRRNSTQWSGRTQSLRRLHKLRRYLTESGFRRRHDHRARHRQCLQAAAAPSGKGAPAGFHDPTQAGLDPGQGAGLARLRGDTRDRARQPAAYGVRGGRLPQYRRVLGKEARDLHDHGRHLHARLRLLQRQDRLARSRSMPPSRSMSPTPPPSSGLPTSSSPRSIATISTMAARSISPTPSALSAHAARERRSRC